LHDRWDGSLAKMAALVASASLITWALNPGAAHIAFASALAFGCAAAADWIAYTALRGRPWLIRSNGSNVLGAGVDSLLFPTLAFGALLPEIVLLQFLAKTAGGAVWSFLLRKRAAA
jgi:uncharacterized PurR-regulated membrane protein YhhQ (DUF165 family)